MPRKNGDLPPPTRAGWLALIVSGIAGTISIFIHLEKVQPLFHDEAVGLTVGIGIFAAAFTATLTVGWIVGRRYGIKLFGEDDGIRMRQNPLKVRAICAISCCALMFLLGLLFNTGTDSANLEILIYAGAGLFTGWGLGRAVNIVLN